jgi:hypothetical protein
MGDSSEPLLGRGRSIHETGWLMMQNQFDRQTKERTIV